MKKNIIFTIALTLIALTSLGMWGDLSKAGPTMKAFPLYMLPVIAIFGFCNDLIKFFRWHLYLKKTEIQIDLKRSLTIFIAGLSMSATPGKLGFVVKSQMLKSLCGRTLLETSPIIIAELYMDLIALSFISLLGLHFVGIGGIWIALGVCILPLLGIIPGVSDKVLSLISKIPYCSSRATELKTAINDMFKLFGPRLAATAFLISLLAWTSEGIALHLILKYMGFSMGIPEATIIFGFATLAGALSMLPGGLVVTDASLMGLIINSGASVTTAALAALMGRIFTLWLSVFIGSIVLLLNRRYLHAES